MLRRSAHFLMFCFCSSLQESHRRCRAFQAAYALHRSKARPAPENLQLHRNFHNFNLNHMVSQNGGYMGILPHEGSKKIKKNNYIWECWDRNLTISWFDVEPFPRIDVRASRRHLQCIDLSRMEWESKSESGSSQDIKYPKMIRQCVSVFRNC